MNKYEILEEFKEYLNYSNVIKKVENFIFKKTNQYKLDELETIEFRKGWQNKKGTATNYAK
ncbi:hypothetical protein [Streptobacillus moniliformis]|uniref:hypothetical protein n=1 Tax=Streptobacillus moniliformis TaxID=34105 RepID=UPI0007E3B2CE|nr:hypothetical protein [Streptobacillus moniliformis]